MVCVFEEGLWQAEVGYVLLPVWLTWSYVETVDIYTLKRFLHPFMRESEPAQVGGGVEL